MADDSLSIPVLTEKNWVHWCKNMVVTLKCCRLWSVVNGVEAVVTVQQKVRAKGLIISSVSYDLLPLLIDLDDPAQIWKDLMHYFGHSLFPHFSQLTSKTQTVPIQLISSVKWTYRAGYRLIADRCFVDMAEALIADIPVARI